MPRATPSPILMVALAVLYLMSLGGVGFLGPDEPRYAAIGRHMAESGDWITPVLDGQPWFEKPPLLYWMTGLGHLFGLPGEWATRLPLALVSLAFLWFFHGVISREFSPRVGFFATAILGTSAGWIAYSFAAVTDLPLSATFGAALLIALFGPVAVPTREPRSDRPAYWAGAMLGLAVLAKGFVPLVLFLPAWLIARGKRWPILVSSVAVATPWYIACTLVNGADFWNEFFWRHHVSRFFEPDLQHVQPFWFYVPVTLGALFPWTPLAAFLALPRTIEDLRVRFLLLTAIWGFLFFSLSGNKLPGYILPLLAPLAVAIAVGFDQATREGEGFRFHDDSRGGPAGWWLAVCGLLLAAVPVIGSILPEALRTGITHTDPPLSLGWPFLLLAGVVWGVAWTGQREWAVMLVALSSLCAVGYLKWTVFEPLDSQVSARAFYEENRETLTSNEVCTDPGVARDWIYGLNYYLERPLPECGDAPLRIQETDDGLVLRQGGG